MQQLLLLTLLLAGSIKASGQARATQYSTPLVGTVRLQEVEDKYLPQVYNLEMPAPDANADKRRLRLAKEESAHRFPHKRTPASARKTTSAIAPVVAVGFVSDSMSQIPPDNDLAVSRKDTAVAVMNSRLAILDTKTGYIVNRLSLRGISKAAGLNDIILDHKYDPKIIYDSDADRFICVMLNATNDRNYILVGFSRTDAPGGEWNFYKFHGNYKGDTTWFDYPAISVTQNEFFITGNKIAFGGSWQQGFKETVVYQISKADGYSGAANLNYQIWDNIEYNGRPIRNLFPVKPATGTSGPEQYFLSNRNFDVLNDTIFLVKIPDVIGSGNSNFTIEALTSPVVYGAPPNGRQPDTSVVLATNDARILGAVAYKNDLHFVGTSIDTSNGSSGIYHGIISNYATTPVISHASIFSVDTLDFGYPNISFAPNPWDKVNAMISFNFTGPNTFPGLAAINFDGSDYSDLVEVKSGISSIKVLSGKEQRWGDYSGSQPDLNNYGSVWIVGIYGRDDNRYGSWMAKLNASFVSVKDNKPKETELKLFPNPAFRHITIDFENPEAQVLHFAIYDVNGKMVDRILEQHCKKGKTRIQFNIASLPAGQYFLRATNSNGSLVAGSKFIRN